MRLNALRELRERACSAAQKLRPDADGVTFTTNTVAPARVDDKLEAWTKQLEPLVT